MSDNIRSRSIRNESIWRQETLLAGFTSTSAKQRINNAARAAFGEIIVAIKNFADRKEEKGIMIAVKRIVKVAAETWRFAKLKRNIITAVMPKIQDEKHEFSGQI